MKKYIRKLHNVALLIFVCGFVLDRFLNVEWGEYLIWTFGVMWAFELIWGFTHWSEYRKENKENLVFLAIISVLVIIAYIVG